MMAPKPAERFNPNPNVQHIRPFNPPKIKKHRLTKIHKKWQISWKYLINKNNFENNLVF